MAAPPSQHRPLPEEADAADHSPQASSSLAGTAPSVMNSDVADAKRLVDKLETEKDELTALVKGLSALRMDVYRCRKSHEAVPAAVQEKLAAAGIFDVNNLDTVLAELSKKIDAAEARISKTRATLAEALKQQNLAMTQNLERSKRHYEQLRARYAAPVIWGEGGVAACYDELRAADLDEVPRFFSHFPIHLMKVVSSSGADDKASTKQGKQAVVSGANGKCTVCDRKCDDNVPLSAAHILKARTACQALSLKYSEKNNYIALCGCRGMEGTCHDAFDKGFMSFLCVPEKENTWMVVGTAHHGKHLELPTQPHKTALHTHLAWCVRTETVERSIEHAKIATWLSSVEESLVKGEVPVDVTPPDSPEKDQEEEEETTRGVHRGGRGKQSTHRHRRGAGRGVPTLPDSPEKDQEEEEETTRVHKGGRGKQSTHRHRRGAGRGRGRGR